MIAALLAALPSVLAAPLSIAGSHQATGYSIEVIEGRCHGCERAHADGGMTWSKGSVPATDGWVVHCTRSNEAAAWLVSWRPNDEGSEVLRSSDAGQTWARVLDPTINGRGYYVSTIDFLTDDLGFAFARRHQDKGSDMLVTHDAGAHWSRERRLSQRVTECALFDGAIWCAAGMDIVKISQASGSSR